MVTPGPTPIACAGPLPAGPTIGVGPMVSLLYWRASIPADRLLTVTTVPEVTETLAEPEALMPTLPTPSVRTEVELTVTFVEYTPNGSDSARMPAELLLCVTT